MVFHAVCLYIPLQFLLGLCHHLVTSSFSYCTAHSDYHSLRYVDRWGLIISFVVLFSLPRLPFFLFDLVDFFYLPFFRALFRLAFSHYTFLSIRVSFFFPLFSFFLTVSLRRSIALGFIELHSTTWSKTLIAVVTQQRHELALFL
jgi:hypothetical protein